MPLPTDGKRLALAKEVIQAFDDLHGVFPGHRPAHAKGILMAGSFTPTPEAAQLSVAPHFQATTPVFLRFSNFAGVPTAADNNPNESSPRGCGLRFQLGDHVHTDIVAHSTDGFPARTAQEFVEFLHALRASGPDVPHPSPIEQFLGSHPKALAFVQTPKPIPTSFARESFFSVSAYEFINAAGARQFVRYRILPDAGNEYLSAEAAAAQGPNFLMEELVKRVASGPAKMQLWVQLAAVGDVVDNAQESWPADRPQVLLGVISLTQRVPDDDAEGRRIIFDPIPRVAGIEPSSDPLLEPRADVYVMAGKRRREQAAH
ncbi:MAG: catalase family peroxidase [Chthoniobacter sp.]|uniref:catalase family peroxidase n=1 Tax=Chthoniobacter sp. TaxID=2510640 RepID=UPI0032ACB358